MNLPTLKFASLHAGVLAALLLGGCGGDSVTPSGSEDAVGTDDDESEDADDAKPSKDAGVKKDAGKDSGAKPTGVDAGGSGIKTDGGSGPKATGELPCDVKAILESNCSMCHGTETAFGAPMSLVTLADFQGKAITGAAMTAQVKKRINDTNANTAMPPSTGTKLTTAQLATLNAWVDGGAGAGDGKTCEDTGTTIPVVDTSPHDTTGLDCYKMVAHGNGAEKFKVGTAIDSYYNFTFTAPWTGTGYGVLFNPIIDNKKALHHFLLFQNTRKTAASGAVKSSGAHPDGQLVYGWAPGGQPLDFRDTIPKVDVGFELNAGVSYTVEYHYNSSDPTAQDASGVELCLSKTKPANIAAISWLGYDNLLVPSTTWTGQCVPTNTQPVHIIGVQPHMHVTGKHMKGIIHRKGGGDEVLHDEPFDFNNQVHYMKNVTLNPGDTITTTCEYTQPMAFGESTGQEMCYLFTYAYAKGQLKDNGTWGSTAHGGSACLGQ